MKTLNITLIVLIGALLIACEPKIDDFQPDAGTANLSVYVAIGSGMTAGFADGELYRKMQMNSLGNILSGQFALAGGGGVFKQPLMLDELGFGQKRVLGYATDCKGVVSLAPIMAGGSPNPGNFGTIAALGPYHNMGVPGAKLPHLLAPGLGVLNPYFGRFAANPASSSIIGDAAGLSPSFFSLWAGIEDAVWFAKEGGLHQTETLTPDSLFAGYLNQILTVLQSNGAKGVIGNVPDILSMPYFTTVPYNGLVLTAQAQVDMLNAAYGPYGLNFNLGPNPWVIQDPGSALGFRQILPGELILLNIPQDSLKCAGWGTLSPIPHKYVLNMEEITLTRSAIQAYNSIIAQAAQAKGLALADVYTALKNAEKGVIFDGVSLDTRFVQGGLFSLDGLHLNAKGNAVIANLFIQAINAKYSAGIPTVNVNEFPGVAFP